MARYEKTLYPATAQPFASSTGYPKSGLFAMHITYPDTAYDDDVTDWEYGTNASSNWKQGLTVVVRTPIAHEALPTEATNVIGVDLKAAAAAATAGGLSLTYDLGTEEATRLIAAKINSRKAKQVSERGLTRLLRARYVRMSGRETITGASFAANDANTMVVSLSIPYQHGYPSDLPKQGRIVVVGGTAAGTYNYTDLSLRFLTSTLAFVKLTIASHGISVGATGATSVTFDAEPPKHTVVLSWEKNAPSSDAGYWSGANLGPIIQGIGTTVPQWKMLAKPMDGGNMALPAVNAVSRSGKSADIDGAATSGFSRFSIEGLNSCITPNIPPPDYNITAPTVEGVLTAATTQPTTTGNLNIETLEYGSNFFGESDTVGISLENGYTSALSADVDDMMPARDSTTISSVSHTADTLNYGIIDDNAKTYSRPFRTTNTVNSERVKGLVISNEELVFEDLPVVDDQGNELILKGGSPLGTVIRDFKLQNAREIDDETIVGPSSPNDAFSPNLQIQLPDETQIPGEIFVRSGHDRVQAWSNLSWGMGGLSAPDPRKAGVAEASNEASQFDTHDRMLIFHCKRILHPSMSLTGIDSNITAGSQPSGTTRFFTAHKISDHTERGSVLKQTNNGTATGELYPHHRIRFGRQGHSFVSPIGHRGTPMNLRRQLHRSFGSSYSLMFETKSEHKHFGFGSGASTNSTTRYDLDTLDLKGTSGYDEATGSFSSDGLPQEEIGGSRLDNHKRNYSSTTPRKNVDYLIAPGQEHAKVEGSNQSVSQATVSTTTISGVATPTHLTLTDALTFNNRGNVANEFMVNGFLVGDCTLFGGRPQPNVITSDAGNHYVSGSPHGSIAVRSATELATVPPLLLHDPEMLNASATPIRVGSNYVVTGSLDMGLLKESDTNTGCVPDAFLCSWLAEYGHPAFFGTNREHFMTFRYREAGMPRSTNYPATRQILLRNYSPNTTAGQAVNAQAFERLYAVQWLQNQGFNGLNAGGHGNVKGLRSAGAVLMGHTTIREPAGTMRIIKPTSGSERLTRGEGIGDGIDPLQEGSRLTVDTDSDGEATTKFYFLMDSRTTVNYSRHLPIRAWGTRTASDALDMLAGDPTENQNAQKVEGKGRFDGGIHDSMNLIPNATAYGADWNMPANYAGIERNLPVGIVMSGHTAEATPFFGLRRLSNTPVLSHEEQIGIGRRLNLTEFGMLSPLAHASGHWDVETDGSSFDTTPQNKGLDPHIDLIQFKGSTSYPQSESPMALSKSAGAFGASADFFTLKGNALKTNAASVHYSTTNDHYPVTGWGIGSESGGTVQSVAPIPLSEISEQRHLQSKGQPRLGVVMEVESERKDAKNTEYQVLSTKAVSLNADLGIGQIYPVLPSWSMNTQFTTKAFTTTSGSASHTVANIDQKPVWSPDTNATKGAVTVSGDSVRVDAMTHGKDVWTVRGAGDLPAWGGVFILRKSYLNRAEEGGRGSDMPASGTIAQASIPKRRYVDYAIRLVRPLKMYGFASNLMQDGWLLGARCSTSNSGGLGFQPFTRDKRYGVFEINADRALNQVDLISSANGAFEMEWPDANEHDVVWHLIPTSNMLQHFKSDAVRKNDGEIVSDIDARFSQITHAGGDEELYQSESRYATDGTGVGGDFAKQTDEGEYRQSSTMLDAIPAVRIIRNLSVGLLAERRLDLPASGKLMAVGVVGYITYTSIDGYVLKGISHAGSTASIDFDSGVDLYLTDSTDTTTARTLRDAISHTPANVTAPSFIDNSVVLSKVQNNTWRRYDSSTDAVAKTTVNFKGLLPYDPTDFIMVNQSPFILFDGSSQGLVKAYNRSFIQIDGQNLSASFFPPYLFDSAGHLWRISEIKEKQDKRFAVFRNTEGELLSQSGFELGNVIAGQYGAIGLRTSDVALQLLDKSAGSLAGFMAMPSSSITQNTFKTLNTLDAHPALHLMNQHSKTYVSRPTRGLNVMEVIKSLTEMDGRQLVVEKNGVMVYSEKAFNETENRIGSDSGAQLVRVSRMFDSPNQVIIIGDQVAENETVKVVVKDLEKMRQAAGSNAEDNLVRTLQKEVPGLKTKKEALTVAKALLSRAENGAPLVSIEGLLKATSVNPGDIIEIDLPIHGVKGRFAVFEASHSYTKATSNLIVAQYEKGIEGLLSDIQAATSNPTRQSESQKKNELNELALNGSVRVIAVVKRYVRHNNSQHFIIGAKHGGGLGKIGTRDSNKRGKPIGQSKSRFFEVK